jgi:transposase
LIWQESDDGVMVDSEAVGRVRRERKWRSVAEKRRIAELTLEPGASVALVARAHGVNANQVFKWRQDYRSGLLLEAGETATSLIPVVVAPASSEGDVEMGLPTSPVPATPAGAIHIDLPGRASISVEHGADAALLRMILESLRR